MLSNFWCCSMEGAMIMWNQNVVIMLRMPDKRRHDAMLSPTAESQRKSPLCLLSCIFFWDIFCVRESSQQFWGLPVLNVRNFQCNFMDILWDSTGASSNGCPEAAEADIFGIHPDATGTGPTCYFKHLIYLKCTFLLWGNSASFKVRSSDNTVTKDFCPQWISEWNTRLWLASPGRMLAEQTRVNVRLPWFHSSLWLVPKG